MTKETEMILADLLQAEQRRRQHDRETQSDRHPNLSIAEGTFLDHMTRCGSEAYPVRKIGRKWWVGEAFGIDGPPTPFKTKREAYAFVDRYLDILLDKLAGSLK